MNYTYSQTFLNVFTGKNIFNIFLIFNQEKQLDKKSNLESLGQTESEVKTFLTIIKYTVYILFLKYAGMRQNDCVVITQNFVSRQELMECIAKLKFLSNHWPTGKYFDKL